AVAALDRLLLSTAEINAVMAATRDDRPYKPLEHVGRQSRGHGYELPCGVWPGGGQDLHRAARMDGNGRPGTPRTRRCVDALRPAIRRRVPVCCRCRRLLYRVVEQLASLLQPAISLHPGRPGPDRVWTTAQVSNATGTLAISLVLAGVRHWTCQHALTVANKVAVGRPSVWLQ